MSSTLFDWTTASIIFPAMLEVPQMEICSFATLRQFRRRSKGCQAPILRTETAMVARRCLLCLATTY